MACPLFDTNNNGSATVGVAGAWRSIRIDKYSNDRNVAVLTELEPAYINQVDNNPTPQTAQFLGSLAPNEKSGDDNRRLGFEIDGVIAFDKPGDVDVYSFSANPGTEVWIDLDRTSFGVDLMVELIDTVGNVVARSLNNTTLTGTAQTINKEAYLGRDTFTTSTKDAGLRAVLTGTGTNVPFFVRVRSQPVAGQENNVTGGLTSGYYQLQVRLRQEDEKPGSTVRFADIRFATNGVEVLGQPYHSPLAGETVEASDATNNAFAGAQPMGNLLTADRNTISVGGLISSVGDVDFYRFDLNVDLIQVISGSSDGGQSWATMFDLDYADGITRADTTLSVYDQTGRLILVSRESDIVDDQPAAGQGADFDDLSRGGAGKLDPYIGTVQLPAGVGGASRTYYVAVSSNRRLPTVLDQTFLDAPTQALVRLEPIDSITRVAEDHFDASGPSTLDPATTPTLIDSSTATALALHVGAFSLDDVNLYVSQLNRIFMVDPFQGSNEPSINIGAPGNGLKDITFRTDGVLYGYQQINAANTAGRLNTIDTGTAASTLVGNDNIPDFDPQNPNIVQQLTTSAVDALAFGGAASTNTRTLYYTIPDTASQGSRLYRADPTTGNAAVVAGAPWGRVGGTRVITSSTPATATSVFAGGGGIINFTARTPGTPGNGITVNYTEAALGPGVPPTVTVTGNTINVVLNTDGQFATATSDFGTMTQLIRFTADTVGAGGNNIRLVFTEQDLGNGTAPTISVAGSTINVVLNTNTASPTTASQLVAALNNPANPSANLINASVITAGGTDVTAMISNGFAVQLAGGGNSTTTFNAVTQINAVASNLVNATVGAGPNVQITGGPYPHSDTLLGGTGLPRGMTTGIAFANDFNLYGVSDQGQFYEIDTAPLATGTLALNVVDIDPDNDPSTPGPIFSGLTLGPQNVENGAYADFLFAVDTSGNLYALDTAGNLQTIFDSDGDGAADSNVLDTGVFALTGLAFSPLDFNLWHPTYRQQNTPGHDIGASPTLTTNIGIPASPTNPAIPTLPRRGNDPVGNKSFYFGLEPYSNNPGANTSTYEVVPGTSGSTQFGILSDITQQELSFNALLANNYNLPGGAFGSLETGTFSLVGYSRTDKPTVYFDYFLNTEDRNSANNSGLMRDSARVYITYTTSGGTTVTELLATNNETPDSPTTIPIEGELPTFQSASVIEMPTNTRQQVQLLHDRPTGTPWRQARVDLSALRGPAGAPTPVRLLHGRLDQSAGAVRGVVRQFLRKRESPEQFVRGVLCR